MRHGTQDFFLKRVHSGKIVFPCEGLFELTYECNLDCLHCYCKSISPDDNELNTAEVKIILDELYRGGCLWLTLTGGEPLIRKDFLEIYAHAKSRGFIISIFSNGQLFSPQIIDYLEKCPPFSIEITLNGITDGTYETITRVEGSFARAINNIRILAERKLPVIIKSNLLQQNKNEIAKIKKWAEDNLGRPRGRHNFKYDPFLYPKLNGDKGPCQYRLSFSEMADVFKRDKDIWRQYQEWLHKDYPVAKRKEHFLYHCNAWMKQFFINPTGRLKFCLFSNKFSVDLKKVSFKEGFYAMVSSVSSAQFDANSNCQGCRLRPICWCCPSRAYLETGDEESAVSYYCEITRRISRLTNKFLHVN